MDCAFSHKSVSSPIDVTVFSSNSDINVFARRYYLFPDSINRDNELPKTLDDLPKTIKRQLTMYENREHVNMRLLINNIIIFLNSFEQDAGKIILLFKITKRSHREKLKAILVSLFVIDESEWNPQITTDESFRQLVLDTLEQNK